MGSAAVQGRLWGVAARDWARLAEPAATPFYDAVFDAIGVGPGMSLLDARQDNVFRFLVARA